MMDIYAPVGTKVRFLNENGYDFELEHAKKVFDVNKTYTVKDITIYSSSSDVVFEEVDGEWNTVMFTEV